MMDDVYEVWSKKKFKSLVVMVERSARRKLPGGWNDGASLGVFFARPQVALIFDTHELLYSRRAHWEGFMGVNGIGILILRCRAGVREGGSRN